MESINKIAIYGMFFGMIGTTVGGIIGAVSNIKFCFRICSRTYDSCNNI